VRVCKIVFAADMDSMNPDPTSGNSSIEIQKFREREKRMRPMPNLMSEVTIVRPSLLVAVACEENCADHARCLRRPSGVRYHLPRRAEYLWRRLA
jgi:hypothetical protein